MKKDILEIESKATKHKPANNKQQEIVAMFDSIASNYDLANRVLSFGIDTRWRKEACEKAIKLCNKNTLNILDVACGTGDMILNWLKIVPENKIKSNKLNSEAIPKIISICGIDPSSEMLKIARQKLPSSVVLQNGEAKDLHIESNSVDILSIAYGLRNVVELDLALHEFARVLKNDGILVILEFSKKDNENIFDKIARFYTKRILPYIGGFISKNYVAYRYLPNSVDDFLSLEQIALKLKDLGFDIKVSKRYIGNVCSLIIAQKYLCASNDLHNSKSKD